MLNLICDGVSKIVSTGIKGTSFIIPLGILLYAFYGQAKEFKKEIKKIWG